MKFRDKPCDRCGWKYPGFHICVDLTTPEPKLVVPKKVRKHNPDRYDTKRQSPEWRAKISEARKQYFARIREENHDRDQKIVNMYALEQASSREVAEAFGIDRRIVMAVLRRARDEGRVVIRPNVKRKKD